MWFTHNGYELLEPCFRGRLSFHLLLEVLQNPRPRFTRNGVNRSYPERSETGVWGEPPGKISNTSKDE